MKNLRLKKYSIKENENFLINNIKKLYETKCHEILQEFNENICSSAVGLYFARF